jgi:hypothetical protein
MVRAKRKRVARSFCKTCQVLAKNVNEAVVEEKKKRRLCAGINKSVERVIKYLRISRHAFHSLIRAPATRSRSNIETRNRAILMPLEDEMKIRPALMILISEKITPE